MEKTSRILIIEHDHLVGLDLQRQLEIDGYSVLKTLLLVDTERLFSYETPDLVIINTDIQQQNNFDRVKKFLSEKHFPVILTGTATNKDIMESFDGINTIGIFSKPFDSKNILALVNEYFIRGN